MLMLMIIAGGVLYVILDDKYFCMQPSRTQLGPHQQHLNVNGLKIEDAEPNPQTEEEEQLFTRRLQHSEKDSNRDLLKNLANVGRNVPRRTISSRKGSNLLKNNIMGDRSCYAPSSFHKSEIGENSERYSQRSNSNVLFHIHSNVPTSNSHRNSLGQDKTTRATQHMARKLHHMPYSDPMSPTSNEMRGNSTVIAVESLDESNVSPQPKRPSGTGQAGRPPLPATSSRPMNPSINRGRS